MALWSDEDLELREKKTRVRAPSRARESAGEGSTVLRVLSVGALLLVLAIAAGTIYGFTAGTRQKKLELEADRAQVAAELVGRASFTGIGTVRAKSADAKAAAVIVATIAFPYDSGDRPFAEELGRKGAVLRAAALAILSSKRRPSWFQPTRARSRRPCATPSTRGCPWAR